MGTSNSAAATGRREIVCEVIRDAGFVENDAPQALRLAARSVNPPGDEILAGERTVAAVRGAFEFGDARSIEAKGKPAKSLDKQLLDDLDAGLRADCRVRHEWNDPARGSPA